MATPVKRKAVTFDESASKKSKEEVEPPGNEDQVVPMGDQRTSVDFWLIMGGPNRGKSHLMRWKIVEGFLQGKWEFIVILSPTKHNGDFAFIQPQEFVWDDPRQFEGAVQKLLDNQRMLANKVGMQNVPRCLLLIDDPLGAINWHKGIWEQLVSTYRQFMIDVMLATQYMARLPLHFFAMASKGAIFKMDLMQDVEKVWQRWLAACGLPMKSAKELMDYMNEKMPINARKYLEIDRNPKATVPVKLTKAPPKEQFDQIKIQI